MQMLPEHAQGTYGWKSPILRLYFSAETSLIQHMRHFYGYINRSRTLELRDPLPMRTQQAGKAHAL